MLCIDVSQQKKSYWFAFWLPGMPRQLLPEGACGDSGLSSKDRVWISIWRPGGLEMINRWLSTLKSACGYAGMACQLLPKGV